ncbi:MAG: hypothetical protein HQL52_03765 [Magnetococcales bacterium]|nr:hypothetical protein [Magnetococcales bacterium]
MNQADKNYIEGRCLWFNWFYGGACNLLWLGVEQLFKLLILQNKLSEFPEEPSNLEEHFKVAEKKARKFGHNVDKLMDAIHRIHPDIEIHQHNATLKNIHYYFKRRYVINESGLMRGDTIDAVDEVYFSLRGKVQPEAGGRLMDEIFIQKKHKTGHPIPGFAFAYHRNKSFRPRKHEVRHMQIGNEFYAEAGQHDAILCSDWKEGQG